MRKLTLSLDFDGVICSNQYPQCGVLLKGSEAIRDWYKTHTIIISTCRTGRYADAARNYLAHHDIPYHYFNENSAGRIQQYGTDTRKISADLYVDDRVVGGFRGWKPIIAEVKKLESRLPIVVCIVGESGAGKSYLSRRIEETYGHTLIHSYTDRPSRGPGDDHVFLTKEQFDAIPQEDMIAFTQYGTYRYCCTRHDVREFNTYIISEDGMLHLLKNFSYIYDIRTIRVQCPEEIRLVRVGGERVERDKGRFNIRNGGFDVVLRTDREYNVHSLEEVLI